MILHPTAKIGRDCRIGPNVSIGIECVIEDGARISNSVLLHRVKARLLVSSVVRVGTCKDLSSLISGGRASPPRCCCTASRRVY